jgi:hypothetical protein
LLGIILQPSANPLTGVMFGSFRPPPGRVTMPDVCCDISWEREKLILSGPQSRGRPNTCIGEPIQLMNVDPLVARAWLGVPLEHLTDYNVPLEDVAPEVAGALSEVFFRGLAANLVVPIGPPPRDHRRVAKAAAALRGGRSLRFRRSVAALREGETLAGAAAVTGFADQSHFTREVIELMGRPPSALLDRVAKVQEVIVKTRDY